MSDQERIQVYVATHKKIDFPLPDYCTRMQVNTAVNEKWPDYLHDADGENIAEKNANYSELTVLYALWKNCDAEIKGLMHYRRYLSDRDDLPLYHADTVPAEQVADACISEAHIRAALETHDVIIPHPEGPFPRNVAEDLLRFCYLNDVNVMLDVIEEQHPEDVEALYAVLASEHVSYCNMMIARKELFDDYCAWLFDILFEVEARCDLSGYDAQHARLYGYLSEILMDVYLLRHGCRCKFQQIFMPVDDTSKALRVRSELKRARNRAHDALRLPPLHPYHRARYEANQRLMALRETMPGANLIVDVAVAASAADASSDLQHPAQPVPSEPLPRAQQLDQAASSGSSPTARQSSAGASSKEQSAGDVLRDTIKKGAEAPYDPAALAETIRAEMKRLGAKHIRPFPTGGETKRPGIFAHFKESDFLYVILQPGDLTNEKAMSAFLDDIEHRRASLEMGSGIPALLRLVIPEEPDDLTTRIFLRQGIRLCPAGTRS